MKRATVVPRAWTPGGQARSPQSSGGAHDQEEHRTRQRGHCGSGWGSAPVPDRGPRPALPCGRVFLLLESRGLECQLYNSAQVKALPGRPKTDGADSNWIAKITERRMIASSFVPPEP